MKLVWFWSAEGSRTHTKDLIFSEAFLKVELQAAEYMLLSKNEQEQAWDAAPVYFQGALSVN